MFLKVVVFAISVLALKANSQCVTTIRKAVPSCNSYLPCTVAQQLRGTPPVVTTLIDNSVSNGLANAIQLLILSNIIESQNCRAPVAAIEQDYCCPGNSYTEVISYEVPCNCGQIIESPCLCDSEGLTYVDVGASSFCSFPQPCSPVINERVLQSSVPTQFCNVGYSSPSLPCNFNGESITYVETCE